MLLKPKLLILCTGNSCRSQMAEGWARLFHGERWAVASAGVEKHGLNPRALAVMQEAGVSMEGHSSKLLTELGSLEFNLVLTVCDNAAEACPVFPGSARVMHRSFDDPPGLTKDMVDEEQILPVYRRVRDEIRDWLRELPELLEVSRG